MDEYDREKERDASDGCLLAWEEYVKSGQYDLDRETERKGGRGEREK